MSATSDLARFTAELRGEALIEHVRQLDRRERFSWSNLFSPSAQHKEADL
jgi:hypothetical protein